jgi:hypothetical protein
MRRQLAEYSRRPSDFRSRSEKTDFLLGYRRSGIGCCGGVDPLQNGGKKLHIEKGPVMQKHRPPPLLREVTGHYQVLLGTSAHKKGAVAVVGE